MRVYISGPMTGYPDFNYPEFHRVADDWRKLGHDVFCPAENFKGSTDYPWEFYMKEDLRLVMHCDAIVLLAGWDRSRGALMEALVAMTCGLTLFNEWGQDIPASMGTIGGWLKRWENEHRNQRKDEVGEVNAHRSVAKGHEQHSGAESSRTTQGSSSDSRVEREEQSYPARLGTVRLRQGTVTFSGIASGEKWRTEPAGNPMS